MDVSIKELTTRQLQTLLKKKGLPIHYKRKTELLTRLASALSIEKNQPSAEIPDFSSTSESEESEVEGTFLDSINISQIEVKDSVNSLNNSKHTKGMSEPVSNNSITFRDVAESLNTFNGESGRDVIEFISEFEANCEVFKWTSIQKYVYLKKLLRGAAKLCVESTSDISNFETLAQVLKTEFNVKESSIDIHRKLSAKKKSNDETFLEYVYQMKKIAMRGEIDEKSVVAYIIDGIPDHKANKIMLYEANTIAELRKRLEAYERFVFSNKSSNFSILDKKQIKSDQSQNNSKQNMFAKKSRCMNCGSLSHNNYNCPNRSKGSRCFKCSEFGHMAINCTNPSPSTSTANAVQKPSGVNCIALPSMHVKAKIDGKEFLALVDTGSDVSLVKHSVYTTLQHPPKLNNNRRILSGLADSCTYTIGSINILLNICHENFNLMCFVVGDHVINTDMIIGKNLLEAAELFIKGGKVEIKKVNPCCDIPENNINNISNVLFIEGNEMDSINKIHNFESRKAVKQMVESYSPVTPKVSCIKLQLILDNEIPVYQTPRRLAPIERKIVNDQVEKWIADGIVRASKSNFASPITLVKKKNGSHRLCIDYRKLNEKIVKDRYPLPIMEDIIESLYNATIFTTLDLKNGFFHVDMEENSVKYSAFVTPDGHYEFLKAPFGLCNSPAVFQKYIHIIFQDLMRKGIMNIYMDDIIVASETEAENISRLKDIFKVAQQHGLIFNIPKCQFLQKSIEFLGHVVEKGSIKPSIEKSKAIRNFPTPKSIKDLQRFLGLCSFFRKFINGFSTIAKPLSDMLRNNARFNFGDEQKYAFEILKEKLSNEPILKMYNPELQTELHTDASAVGYGGCMLQKFDDNQLYPVYYLSFKTSEAESKLSSYELEVLAVIKCLEKLRCYLLGKTFVIYTDCKAFQLTMSKKHLSPKIARWALALEEYDCKVIHRPGTRLRHVDALSRHPVVMVIDAGILKRIRNAQQNDEECKLVRDILKVESTYKNFIIQNDLVYKFIDGNYLLKLPKLMQHDIIKNIHENGHINKRKVAFILNQQYDIQHTEKKIEKVINNCIPCILSSRKAGKQEGYINSIDKNTQPLDTFHIDHLGPIPSTAKNYKYLFVINDAFSKFTWIYAVKTTSADEVLRNLEQQQMVFGNPVRIISDKGSAFTSNAFKEYCERQKIQHVTTTTGIARGNGQVERINGIIVPILTKLSIDNPQNWYKHIHRLQRSLNSTISRSINKTPFEIMFGIPMKSPEEHDVNKIIEEELILEYDDNRNKLRQTARDDINKIQKENKLQYNKGRKESRKYDIGEQVAIQRTQFGTGQKVTPKFLGPYEVINIKRNDRYDVRKIGHGEGPIQTSTASDYMKPWVQNDDLCEASESDA